MRMDIATAGRWEKRNALSPRIWRGSDANLLLCADKWGVRKMKEGFQIPDLLSLCILRF
jgi:hypothetical protein